MLNLNRQIPIIPLTTQFLDYLGELGGGPKTIAQHSLGF